MFKPGDRVKLKRYNPADLPDDEIFEVVRYHAPHNGFLELNNSVGGCEVYHETWLEFVPNGDSMFNLGDYIRSTPDSPVEIEGRIEDIGMAFDLDAVKYYLDNGDVICHKFAYKITPPSNNTCENQQNSKDSCVNKLTITDFIEASLQYNGHSQLSFEQLHKDQVILAMRELEEEYVTDHHRSIEAQIAPDGSGAVYCLGYWSEGSALGHKDRLLFSWDELEGW